jgi:signal transduction histidine kinase/ligand-binding sensor domain-containing protein
VLAFRILVGAISSQALDCCLFASEYLLMAIDAGHPGSILQKLLYGRISHSEVAKLLVLLLSALAILPHQSYPQRPDLPFEEISLGEGIPTFVQCILQDRTGYLWFATWSGLYKYDGYTFVSHRHDPDDSSSIIDNTLSRLYEDRAGVLWIGSWHGLEKFNRMTGTFSHYTPNPLGTGEDGSNNVWAICEDNNGVLWVGTGWGLKQLNRATGKFTSLRYDTTDPGSIFHNSVGAIYEDREGSLWFATGGGLDRFDFRTGKFIHYWNDPSNRHKSWDNTSEYWINSLCGDDTGILWLGTNGGLVEFNPRESTFSTYRFDQKAPQNRITSICQDVITGSLWVATSDGLLSFDRESKAFTHHDLKANYVYSERSGTLWVGTDAGTKKLNRTKQPFTKYPSKDMIYAVCNGNEGRLWIYTFDGWKQFDTRKEQFVPYSFGKDYLFYVWNFGSDLSIRTKEGGIYIQDSLGSTRCSMDSSWKNYLDAASFGWKGKKGYWGGFASGDLDLWEPKTNRVLKIKNFKQPIYWIYEETCGLLWIATYMDKLFCYDYVRDSTIEFLSDTQNPSSISGRQISQIYEDKKGRLWFATNSGLNRYRRSTNSFVHFTERNGLPSNNVRGILEDDHGFLWLNTGKGISKFDPETNQFKNYDVSYGVEPAADLYYGVGCRTRNGEMYFGGAKGFARFHPDSVKDNPFIPPIVVTSFKKFDKPFPVSSEIGLAYDENFISFEFAALSYMSPERNQYAYKMEGLDKDWVYSGTRRYASYPGLEPGEYVFRVKGSNNDGVWNEAGTSIAILISPPWWKNRWAYGLYALALVGAIYGAWRMQMRRVRVRHEYEMSRFEAAKLREVDELKSRFFANISHEFRTPLTLILGPVKRMRDASQDQQTRDDLGLVHKNATRLLELVNQLLDLSRLESGAVKLQAAPENIVPLLKGLLQSFCSYAERKRISMAFTSSAEDIVVYIDREKLQKIITNILANAFKFTPEGGRIEVSVAHDSQYVSVRISDTGIGIPAGKIPQIFDRFYQVDGSHTREQEGTGIGLSLTRENAPVGGRDLRAGGSGEKRGRPGHASPGPPERAGGNTARGNPEPYPQGVGETGPSHRGRQRRCQAIHPTGS